ncbi:MAG: sugar nucleotide-binding protein [Umezawaea sp.]
MRALVVGSGFLGASIGARLRALGVEPVVASRHAPATTSARGLPWRELDVRDPAACHEVVADTDALVVVHGPSDITWCERNPAETAAAHAGGAANIAAAADGRPVLLISTDNVFDGTRASSAEPDGVSPANAYGRAKLAAERTLLDTGAALALRVSLVYGWEPDGIRPNFYTTCARALLDGSGVDVPDDHWNSPVLVDDVAAWTAALLMAGRTGLLHLGGPERLTRYAWARRIALAVGADPALVRSRPRAEGHYASRPVNACLHSTKAHKFPELAPLAPLGVDEGALALTKIAANDVVEDR